MLDDGLGSLFEFGGIAIGVPSGVSLVKQFEIRDAFSFDLFQGWSIVFAMTDKSKLSFGLGNAKLSKSIATFSLPAGHSCPFARECLSKANRLTGKIIDGQHCRFRCFAASQEALFPSVRRARWHNFDLLRSNPTVEKMAGLIQKSLPWGLTMVRTHVSGDYYNENYFLAWLNVAYNNPLMTFYGYTKATPFLAKYKSFLPSNFRFTASKGGTCDKLISKHRLKFAEVVFSIAEAKKKGLEIDHDDSHAFGDSGSFALLLHGSQPAGSEAGRAMSALRKEGINGYSDSANSRKSILERSLEIFITLKDGEIFLPRKAAGFKMAPKFNGVRRFVNV